VGYRGFLLIGLMGVLSVAAFFYPFAGIAAYLIHYHVYPEQAWWGASLAQAGVRFSLGITLCLAVGACFNWSKLPYRRLLTRQELLYFGFLAWLLINRQFHGALTEADGASGDPVEKMLKMSVFLFILTHVVVTDKLFNQLSRVLVLCALYVGYEAYTAPPSAFLGGRLNGYVGGADFTNSNALAAHFLVLCAVIGIYLLRSESWKERLLGLVAGGFAANTIVMTRSRGGFLAAIVGVIAALWLAPKGKRRWVWALLFCGLAGLAVLVDTKYLLRMGTIDLDTHQHEVSAQSRLEIWQATVRMIGANPLGVGPGNFTPRIGEYTEQWGNKDAHNTYLRCLAELGWPGFVLFCLLIVNALCTQFRIIRTTFGEPHLETCHWHAYAFFTATVAYLVASMFGSYIYLETLWLLLLIPAALERAVENAQESHASMPEPPPVKDSLPQKLAAEASAQAIVL
jgi:hypothetical protein